MEGGLDTPEVDWGTGWAGEATFGREMLSLIHQKALAEHPPTNQVEEWPHTPRFGSGGHNV